MFLVERYGSGAWPAGSSDADLWSATGPDDGLGVRLVLSAIVPSDEMTLSLFEAPTERALAGALDARGFSYIRIVEAVLQTGDDDVVQVETVPDLRRSEPE